MTDDINADFLTTIVLEEVARERRRQDAKWGEQNHPSVDPVLSGRSGGCTPERLCKHYEIPTEARAKYLCDTEHHAGVGTYASIAVEEMSEAVSAPDDVARRKELVQLAAVVVGWIECIDRRQAK